jgi:hypothetical protein
VAVDKGAIVDGHVLVLPIEHYPSQLSLSASSFSEMERYLSALRSCFAAQASLAWCAMPCGPSHCAPEGVPSQG